MSFQGGVKMSDNINIYFGERLKTVRKSKGMTQDELGKMTGYTRAGISMIESGKRGADIETINKFADALDVIPAYLMGWADEFGDITYGQVDPIEEAIKNASNEDLFHYMQLITEELRRRG